MPRQYSARPLLTVPRSSFDVFLAEAPQVFSTTAFDGLVLIFVRLKLRRSLAQPLLMAMMSSFDDFGQGPALWAHRFHPVCPLAIGGNSKKNV